MAEHPVTPGAAQDIAPTPSVDLQLRHLAAIVASSDDAIISKTLDGIVTSWNPAAERIFGYPAAEIIGRPLLILFPRDRIDEEDRILEEIRAGRRVEHFETVRIRKDGSAVTVSVSISPIVDGAGQVIGASKIARDITMRTRLEQLVRHQAHYDPLTELPNRRLFIETGILWLIDLQSRGLGAVLLFIDLDGFKAVNEARSHAIGDQLLVQAAARLRQTVPPGAVVARLGGDEFAVLLPDPKSESEVAQTADGIRAAMAQPFRILDRDSFVTASIGVSRCPDDGGDIEVLLIHAEQAMYLAKAHGRDATAFFTAGLGAAASDRAEMVAELRRALQRGEIDLHYQPIVCRGASPGLKFEALLRWSHPRFGSVSPATFIPLAEEYGLILELGDWAFRTAVRQALDWSAGYGLGTTVAVNLSVVQLRAADAYLDSWTKQLEALRGTGAGICLEITESIALDPSEAVMRRIGRLRAAGATIAIDDFGTGYSCLSYLNTLKVDVLKIDRAFVEGLIPGSVNHALCEAIIWMARRLGLEVVAEGVETEEQRDLLMALDCDCIQGYLIAHPAPPARMGPLLAELVAGLSVGQADVEAP